MAKKLLTVAKLAANAGLDIEEALITLWEADLEQYAEPTDLVKNRDLKKVNRALGLATRQDATKPAYWRRLLGLEPAEFDALLAELDVTPAPTARRLPKGAVAKLRRELAARRSEAAVSGDSPAAQPQGGTRAVGASTESRGEARESPFEWRNIGREQELRLLTGGEVVGIHWELARDFAAEEDPIYPAGVASTDLLESAVFRQHTSFGGVAKYPTAEMAAAALLHSIVHDHPFYNGNKRTALVAMIVALDENGVMVTCTETELFRFVLRVANHQLVTRNGNLSDREVLWVAEWIFQNSRNVEKGERPVQWRRLKQILTSFGCTIEQPGGRANRLNITRVLTEKRRLAFPRRRTLSTQVKYADDGREARVDTIKKIRKDLELDDANGCDSVHFYRQSGPFPGEFIVRYRKTLKRLARL